MKGWVAIFTVPLFRFNNNAFVVVIVLWIVKKAAKRAKECFEKLAKISKFKKKILSLNTTGCYPNRFFGSFVDLAGFPLSPKT